jgi:hypothetical protein
LTAGLKTAEGVVAVAATAADLVGYLVGTSSNAPCRILTTDMAVEWY